MARVLLIGDVHLADRPPSACTETYTDDLFDLLQQTVLLAQERGYAAVVQAGDVFHSKIPGRTSHRLVQRALEWVQSYPCRFYIVPGNHDMANDRLESVHVTQPLGVLLRGGASLLHGWAGSLPIYGVPWLAEWNDRDPLDGKHSLGALARAERETQAWREQWDGSTPALLVTHAPFYQPGSELTYEFFPLPVFSTMMGGQGACFYAHVHEPHGEYVVNGVRYCNNGALSRGSLHEYNLTREIAVTEWDTMTGRFERVTLNYRPAAEVFKLHEVSESKALQVSLDDFLASVGSASIDITSTESVLAYVRSLSLGREIETVIEDLLQGATHG